MNSHVFLHTQRLNWDDLAQKKVSAPFRPELKSELDVGNFAEEFTGMDPVYSPASTPPSTDKLFKVSPRHTFNAKLTLFQTHRGSIECVRIYQLAKQSDLPMAQSNFP